MKGGRLYPFAHSKHNEIRAYGLRAHFGGWIYFEYQRRRIRRMWRKRARREAKRWIEEQRSAMSDDDVDIPFAKTMIGSAIRACREMGAPVTESNVWYVLDLQGITHLISDPLIKQALKEQHDHAERQ